MQLKHLFKRDTRLTAKDYYQLQILACTIKAFAARWLDTHLQLNDDKLPLNKDVRDVYVKTTEAFFCHKHFIDRAKQDGLVVLSNHCEDLPPIGRSNILYLTKYNQRAFVFSGNIYIRIGYWGIVSGKYNTRKRANLIGGPLNKRNHWQQLLNNLEAAA